MFNANYEYLPQPYGGVSEHDDDTHSKWGMGRALSLTSPRADYTSKVVQSIPILLQVVGTFSRNCRRIRNAVSAHFRGTRGQKGPSI
jgi:hypothetical protein